MRRKAEEDLKESQSQEMEKPKDIKSVADVLLSLKFEKKAVIPGLEALDASPTAVAVKGKERIYQSTALFCLLPGHEPRRSFIKLVESKPFDPLILITILANCGTMAWESPLDPCCTDKAAFIDVCEWVYLIIFTIEMFSKIIAYGFVWCGNDTAYLTDAWCKLDITVVSLAWLPILIPSFGNYSVIRSVRALRPLRALKRVPGMPVLVSSIMAAFPKMGNVAALCGFVFLVFGIVGMELFKGAMHYRCAFDGFEEHAGYLTDGYLTPGYPSSAVILGSDGIQDNPIESRRLGEIGEIGQISQTGQIVEAGQIGQISEIAQVAAHALGAAGVAAARGALRQGRRGLKGGGGNQGGGEALTAGDLLNYTGKPTDYDTLRFCTIGGSSCPAGQFCAYFDDNPTHNIASFDSVPVAFIAIMQTISFDTWTFCMYALMASFSPLSFIFFWLIVIFGGFFVVNLFLAVILQEFIQAQSMDAAVNQEEERRDEVLSARNHPKDTPSKVGSAYTASRSSSPGVHFEGDALHTVAVDIDETVSMLPGASLDRQLADLVDAPLLGSNSVASDAYADSGGGHKLLVGMKLPDSQMALVKEEMAARDKHRPRTAPTAVKRRGHEKKGPQKSCCDCLPGPTGCRRALHTMVNTSWFGNGSTGLVLLNMVLMCMPYAGQTEEYALKLENAATVISIIFMVEMTMKLLGHGCADYWADGWNKLDGMAHTNETTRIRVLILVLHTPLLAPTRIRMMLAQARSSSCPWSIS